MAITLIWLKRGGHVYYHNILVIKFRQNGEYNGKNGQKMAYYYWLTMKGTQGEMLIPGGWSTRMSSKMKMSQALYGSTAPSSTKEEKWTSRWMSSKISNNAL